jgi:ACT domain-containing protein
MISNLLWYKYHRNVINGNVMLTSNGITIMKCLEVKLNNMVQILYKMTSQKMTIIDVA